MKKLLGIHKWKFLPFPPTFGHIKYMHARVNINSTHIYPTPTSCRDHAGWHRTISHVLALGDPPLKLAVIMQWRYPINNMLGKERRKHWTVWGSERRHHKGVNVGGFSEPHDPSDMEVRAGWWVGSLWVSYLCLNQVNSISVCFIYWYIKWKDLQKKKTLLLLKNKKSENPLSPTLSFYHIRNWDSERLGLLFRTVTGYVH